MVSTLVSIPGYRISEQLYNGSRTLVYRAYREIDSLAVVIKLLKNPYPSFSELLSFRNQYTIAKNLNSPLIIQTYSLQPYQNGYALVMEDFGGISLKEWRVRETGQSLKEFLVLAIALCNTLDILYQERIIHKDIKPANILINPETKQVKLIDFSIASLLPRETQTLINPKVLEGTLAYISPEQTGRMNRGIDYRTDFYSIGVTFYELLTGKLPFASNDPMELVHSHIAKVPEQLTSRREKQIPQVLCDIVMKLMAKNAEDRYQSALGVKFDLENCLHQLQVTGIVKNFKIAQKDVCDRFIIPEKLYGRETEVQTLLQAFERVSLGATEMMLVAGFSGIGKTAVVNEVHKPIVKQRGYFIKGKYDQFNRNIPFSAFVQAFRDLMEQLLTESDDKIQTWKSKILDAVGENAQVIIEVIPELSRIIGLQPQALELSGTAAQNRFNILFQKFVQVFTTKEHPLVIFLDDLQWADSASLKLMQLLMSELAGGYLLLIGAYRDNEVSAAHPLILSLEEIIRSATINTITLAPLSNSSLNQLVADTLSCSREVAQPLTQLIYQKTKGNPFFSTHFFKTLYEDGLIKFDWDGGNWQCDITKVKALAFSNDVVEFIALKLQKLPKSTQSVLKLSACIGNQFDLATLAIVSQQSEIETATALWKALQEGLILPQSEIYKFYIGWSTDDLDQYSQIVNYKFLHDRVQQAAYELIPQDQKQATHLAIGRLLLKNTAVEKLEDNIFEIVNHCNQALDLIIVNEAEKIELAHLNLIAGRKARTAVAYELAMRYLKTGIFILTSTIWKSHYNLALEFYNLAAEIAYLSGDFALMEQWLDVVFEQARTVLDKLGAYQTKIQAYTAQTQQQEVIQFALQVLKDLEIECQEKPNYIEVEQAFAVIQDKLANQTIETLVNLPEMREPKWLGVIQILQAAIPTIYQVNTELFQIMVFKMIDLSLEYGNTSFSSFGYACYGLLLCGKEKVEDGYKFGNVASNLAEKFGDRNIQIRTLFCVNVYINIWKKHLRDVIYSLPEISNLGLEQGEIEFAGYAIFHYSYCSYFSGSALSLLKPQITDRLELLQKIKQDSAASWTQSYLVSICILLQKNASQSLEFKSNFSRLLDSLHKNNDIHGLFHAYLNQTILCYLLEDINKSQEYLEFAEQYLDTITGSVLVTVFVFYDSLVKIKYYLNGDTSEKSRILEKMTTNQLRMQNWAHHAPMNYQHKLDLVSAEKYRVLGRKTEAIELYDQAIAGAKANEYIQEEALANELAAKFYLDWDKEKIAQVYMQEAYYCYARWGALAKVADLERRYPQLLAPILQQIHSPLSTNETIFALGSVTSTSSPTTSSSVSVALDLAAILKASQTISGEIEFEKLLSSLLSIVIENAGADKCVFMLLQDDSLRDTKDERLLIKGSITVGREPVVLQRLPVEDSQDIPLKLIYKVKHNKQTVVLIDASADPTLANDPYIMRQQPYSILCSPILHQGKLMGILYLENNLAKGAFTSDRIELLNLLCAQAAISLENSRLYERSLEYAQQLERSFAELSASNSRFEKLVDNVPGVVYQYRMSADGVISLSYISADCYSLLEVTPVQVMSNLQLFHNMVHPDDAVNYQQSYTDAIQALSPWQWSGRIVTPSGIIKWIHGESRIQIFADGSMVWDGLFLDISERKLAELALQQKSFLLEQALTDLQNAQLQMVQSEKMSALGNLVAGVAHEMNNPLGFITASLKQAKPTITDLVEHLGLYQEIFPNKSDKIIDHAEEIYLDYTLKDLPKMIDSMSMACDRLKNISTSLRTFSRADQDYKVPFNIHEGIDSTILILKHRLKANEQRPAIEVVTNYGNLPQVECFPGQLNQVFMNLLANAIDALDESNTGRIFEEIKVNPNCIKITTSVKNNLVKIAIADNGQGMNEQVKSKIFDHLFTTKAVGKGTGLGLAIARKIVGSTHGGKLSFNSVLGEGTEFIIEIPV